MERGTKRMKITVSVHFSKSSRRSDTHLVFEFLEVFKKRSNRLELRVLSNCEILWDFLVRFFASPFFFLFISRVFETTREGIRVIWIKYHWIKY